MAIDRGGGGDLACKPMGTVTRPDMVDVVQMAAVSDSGVSNTNWITNVRSVQFAGLTSAGAQVSLSYDRPYTA